MIAELHSEKVGLPPGTLLPLGTDIKETELRAVVYSSEDYRFLDDADILAIHKNIQPGTIWWVDITGFKNVELISQIGKVFGVHPLFMEDIVNTTHRPKIEDTDEIICLMLKELRTTADAMVPRHVAIVAGEGFVLTFREEKSQVFDTIYQRIQTNKSNIRSRRLDYLVYRLTDIIVDHYYFCTEAIEDAIQALESQDNLELIHHPEITRRIKRDIRLAQRSLMPLRDTVRYLRSNDTDLITAKTALYFSDVEDHISQLLENLNVSEKELLDSFESQLARIDLRMNEVMKVLTVVSTLFIPPTFIASIYGMNLIMPETGWKFGYPLALTLMVVSVGIMLGYFKKKGWF